MTTIVPGTDPDFSLTKQQQAVVDCDHSAVVVTAPAGTGKTEILVRRAERFLKDPENGYARVLLITYTTRAANEFEMRLRARIGDAMRRITAETVHGFAHSILSAHGSHVGLPVNFQVITKNEDRAELLTEYDCFVLSNNSNELFFEFDTARAKCLDHRYLTSWRAALADSGAVDFAEMVTRATEVLSIPAIGKTLRVVYGLVIIDEAQNLTEQQHKFISAFIGLNEDTGRPLVPTILLGDPKQLVTGFAGGDSIWMKRFSQDYGAQEFALSQNFRSSKRLAQIEQIVSRELAHGEANANESSSEAVEGVLGCQELPDEAAEGEFVANWVAQLLSEGLPLAAALPGESRRVSPEDIAVLGRYSAALNATSEALRMRDLEVARVHADEDFMATSLGDVALLLLRYRSPQHHLAAISALRRELGHPELDLIGDGTSASNCEMTDALRACADEHFDILVPLLGAEAPADFVDALDSCSLPKTVRTEVLAGWPADRRLIDTAWADFANATPVSKRSWTRFVLHIDRLLRARDLGSGVRLLTVHKAQGREFKAVAVVGMSDGQLPDFRATTKELHRAEMQAFYVAVTRASRMLLLTRAFRRQTRYGFRPTDPSPFLQLVQQECDTT